MASKLLAGLASLALGLLWLYLYRTGVKVPANVIAMIRRLFSFDWLYGILWGGFQYLRRLVATLTFVLEGQGGVLWAWLLMLLILAILAQGG